MDYKNAKLIIEKWSEPSSYDSFGTIRTNPENYYVATIGNDGLLTFEGIEAQTREFPHDKVRDWFNGVIRMPKRGY
jgi:hypothetical protein